MHKGGGREAAAPFPFCPTDVGLYLWHHCIRSNRAMYSGRGFLWGYSLP